MTNEERIAREALKAKSFTDWRDVARDSTGAVIVEAARLGIEHGERASAAKIADMKAALEKISVYNSFSGHIAVECLARNFPAPKPSLREAAQAVVRDVNRQSGGGCAIIVSESLVNALRDALAREEGKP